MLAISLLGLAALAVQAADVTGQWTAQVPGRGGQTQDSTFSFKAAGSQLTGSVTTPRGENPISDGKIDGDTISFTQTLEFGGNQVKLLYKGTVSGNEIKFTREREGGQRVQEFVAKRKAS
ncbi:MAG: hypothetical protein WD696_14170 [Bryobacteraceae bacterium]